MQIETLKLHSLLFFCSKLFVKFTFGLDAEFGRIITYDNFDEYKTMMNKTYTHPFIEERCRKAYLENCERIRYHNELAKNGTYDFELRANNLADLSPDQYMRKYVRLQKSLRLKHIDERYERNAPNADTVASIYGGGLPSSLDWRTKGYRPSAKNQKSCGSCYAFSIALTIEAQVFQRTGKLVELSEQQIVDCSGILGNHGCGGGSLRNTLRYLETTQGLMRQKDYPYTASQNLCAYNPELAVVNVTTWAILPSKDEDALQTAIATVGPVAVSINASPQTFQLYSHGIYDDPSCTSKTVNHAMLAVGYTPQYWILKNWWGNSWGEDGYMKIKRNSNLCGVANYAAYAIV